MSQDPPRRLLFSGALLFALGALTGVLVSAVFTGKLSGNPTFMLAAHMNALLGCFWLIAIGTTWKHLNLSPTQAGALMRTAIVAAYANWAVTVIKALLQVQGIDFVGEIRNDTIFGILTLTVVIPTFISSALWVLGLWKKEPS